MSDPRLDDFEEAWWDLRSVVQRALREGPETVRNVLVAAVDRAVETRTHARESLASMHGYWVGDQILFEREVRVGALARELDNFATEWVYGEPSLSASEILRWVARLLVTPNSPEAHHPGDAEI